MPELASGSAEDSRDSLSMGFGESSLTDSGCWRPRTFDDRGDGVFAGDFCGEIERARSAVRFRVSKADVVTSQAAGSCARALPAANPSFGATICKRSRCSCRCWLAECRAARQLANQCDGSTTQDACQLPPLLNTITCMAYLLV